MRKIVHQIRLSICITLFCCYCIAASAQNLDSMMAAANKYAPGDTTRLRIIATAAWSYQFVDLDKALNISEEGLAEARKYKLDISIYKFLVTTATIYQSKSNFDASIALFKEAIQLSIRLNKPKWLHTCYNNLGNTYNLKGDAQLALACHEKSIALKKQNIGTKWGDGYMNIGTIYSNLKDYETAIAKQKIGLTDTLLSSVDSIYLMGNITNLYGGLNNKDSSRKYLAILKKITEQNQQLLPAEKSTYYTSYLSYHFSFDPKNTDRNEMRKGLSIVLETKNENLISSVYGLMMKLYKAQQQTDSAIYYGEQCKGLQERLHNNFELKSAYGTLAELYSNKGNYETAYRYMRLESGINDSIFTNQNAEALRNAEVKYETKQKEERNRLLEKEKKTESKLKNLYLLLGVLSTVLLTFYLLYRKNKAEKILKEQFAVQLLNSQEAERQRLAKELHDSVGQNILFIKNQLQNNDADKEKLLQSVDVALEEVRNISKDLYPNQLEKYGLAAAVEALGEQVKESSGIFVSSDMQGIDEALNKNVQINFYRIIQEFVNNTMKHANATAIRITAQQTKDEIILTVQDNGKGFDKASLESKANKSFGLLNMEERVKMLKGKFDIESEIGKGTKTTFTIPV